MGCDSPNLYHDSHYGYRILNGDIEVIYLPDEGYRIEEVAGLRDDGSDLLLPGRKRLHAKTYIASAVAEISTVLTPGVVWYLAPQLGATSRSGGMAYGHPNAGEHMRDVVYLCIGQHPRDAIRTAYHEAEHALERWLTPDEIEILDEATVPGLWGDAYGDSGVELRAEAFAALAYRLHTGGRLPNHPSAPEMEIVRRIYTVEVGRRRFKPSTLAPRQQSLPAPEVGWIAVARAFGLDPVTGKNRSRRSRAADWLAATDITPRPCSARRQKCSAEPKLSRVSFKTVSAPCPYRVDTV